MPPVPVTVIVPSLPPLQLTSVPLKLQAITNGSVIVYFPTIVHPNASVILTPYSPADNPFKSSVSSSGVSSPSLLQSKV